MISKEAEFSMPRLPASYSVSIGKQQYQVQVTAGGLLLNGEPVALDLVPLDGNGLHLLRQELRNVEVYLRHEAEDTYEMLVAGRRIIARVAGNGDHQEAGGAAGTAVAASPTLTAPMSGVVMDVAVSEGENVSEGQVLVVEEAMKMQMQLRAPCTGRVSRLTVAPGAQVEKGALLVEITPGE